MSKLDALKAQAKDLGIEFHHATGEEKLQKMVNDVLASNLPEPADVIETEPEISEDTISKLDITKEEKPPEIKLKVVTPKLQSPEDRKNLRRSQLRKDCNALVRIRVTNMNPNKKDFPGEIISVSNRVIGTIKKYIPYSGDAAYHVPKVILDAMQTRMCQVFVKKRTAKGGETVQSKLIKEFNIEILPNLNKKELEDLAKKQALSGSIE